jgi:RHS repeat-associated protein
VVYDAAGNVLARIDQRGNRTSFAYDALNRLTQTTDALNNLTTTVFDANDNVAATVDARGNRTSFSYDSLNRLTQTQDAAGGLASVVYDTAGNVLARIDQRGNRTTYSYDADNRLTQTQDAAGGLMSVVYDVAGNVLAQIDQRGNRTSFAYDALNRVVQQTDALNDLTTTVYDPVGNTIATVDARGNRTSYSYDVLNRRTQTTDALNDLSTVVYDAAGNVVNTIDALGHKATFTFDALNRQVTSTNPLGFTTTTAYDAASNATAVTNPRGYTTSFAYDALNRRTQTTDALNDLSTVVYDAAGNVLATVDARGNRTSFSYDGLNRDITRTDALNHTTSTAYDLAGNVVGQVDALGNTTTMAYDSLNRRVSVQDPGGGIASTVYDATSNVVNTIDPLGNKGTFAYDALNRRTQTLDARGGVTTTLYDANGNVTGVIDAVGNRSTFVFDALNRKTQEIDPANNSLTYAYDAAGRLTSQTDRLGRRENYSYDAGNRLTGASWLAVGGSTADTFTFTYDADNNQLTAANGAGTYTLTYDALDRVQTTQQPFGFGQTFTYDAVGNRTLVQDSLGATTTSVYDAVNRLTSRQVGGTGQTQMREDFTYTARNQVATATRYSDAAGTHQVGVSSYTYDAAARLTNLQNGGAAGMVSNFTYTYDLASRVTSETRNGSTVSYSYDAVNQLTNDGTTRYSYDLAGNRNMTGYQTTTGNEMTNDGVYTYTFDAEGNVTKKSKGASADTWTFSYNNANQVTGVQDRSSDGGTLLMQATYTYDANGNRLESDVWTSATNTVTVTRYAYDGWKSPVDGMNRPYSPVGLENWDITADLNGSNAQQTRYLRGDGIDQVLARTDSNGLEWLETDRQGSVRDVVNNAGTVLDHIDYNGFGKIATETGSASGGRLKYTGLEGDAETGLDFAHARFYDPATGRWLEQDPWRFGAGDANLYRYVGNDASNATDPSGLHLIATGAAADAYSDWLRGGTKNAFSAADGGKAGPKLTDKEVVARTLPNGAVLFLPIGDGAKKARDVARKYGDLPELADTLFSLARDTNLLMTFEESNTGPFTVGGKKMKLSLKEDKRLLGWIQEWVNAGGTMEKTVEKSGPDVTDWFAYDLVMEMQHRKKHNKFDAFMNQAANVMSYKWINFGSPGTGRGMNTVVLGKKVMTKNQLGNIALMVVGRIWPPSEILETLAKMRQAMTPNLVRDLGLMTLDLHPTGGLNPVAIDVLAQKTTPVGRAADARVDNVAALGYSIIPNYEQEYFGKLKPNEVLWRADNLAAFGIGVEIADRFLRKINPTNLDEARKTFEREVDTQAGSARFVELMKQTLHELFDGGAKADAALLAATQTYSGLQPGGLGSKMTKDAISFTPNYGGFNLQSLDTTGAPKFEGPTSLGMAARAIKDAHQAYKNRGGTLTFEQWRQQELEDYTKPNGVPPPKP